MADLSIEKLSYEILAEAVKGHGAGFRARTELQPLGGLGDKVFPATYAGGSYSEEKRRENPRDPGSKVLDCVILDSVASQANRAETALLELIEAGTIQLPLISVDFASINDDLVAPLKRLTSLEVPHRLADAILRDSVLEDGSQFSKSTFAKSWSRASLWNATPIYELCPTALLFGMWGSPEKPGGMGAKFERAFVSEIVAVDCERMPERKGFRIDPVNVSSHVLVQKTEDGFQLAGEKAAPKTTVKPSKVNHGNIVCPSVHGGVRFGFAEQTTILSLGALRKLRFPIKGEETREQNEAGRTVLAALGLLASVLVSELGTSLRSRCHLIANESRLWELLGEPGKEPLRFRLGREEAIALFEAAVTAAEHVGLVWRKEVIELRPTEQLGQLIKRSQEVQAKEGSEAGE